VRLEHICDLEIVFERFAFAHADVADTNWICYAEGTGTATGERIQGSVRWSNRARWRDDDVWLPRFDGVIDTDDGAEILWSFRGYNSSSHVDGNWRWRRLDGAMQLLSSDPRYTWVNLASAAVEGAGAWPEDEAEDEEERWTLHVHMIVNEAIGRASGTPAWAKRP